ncbi:MAG: LemA family protein [Alistipes sp.]|jgi:LemA protein|nr:LemA family protein [Alistipes sp.]MBQ6584212.1 LemA family protein [Alistipes sp.]MBR2116844.1 LemA family protein [Alistipes sp.]MEE0916550.1 LemA family protein [Alistipes sp.]
MKKTTLLIVAAVVALLAVYCVTTYNSLAKASQSVAAAWANVETQYQRRSDLIPNLVNTVKGYAAHESETLESVVAARAAATSITVDGASMTAEQFSDYVEAQSKVTSALSRLIAVAENYPELKANQNFLELQAQLEGTENRIAVERQRYNDIVKSFNNQVVTFPRNIIAGMFGFGAKEFFSAQQGADVAPVVAF